MKASKIILGCANLGQKYGIRDKSLKINEFKKIYKFAIKKKYFILTQLQIMEILKNYLVKLKV